MWFGPNGEAPQDEWIDDEYIATGFHKKVKPVVSDLEILTGEEGRELYLSKVGDKLDLVNRKLDYYRQMYANVGIDRDRERLGIISGLVVNGILMVLVILFTKWTMSQNVLLFAVAFLVMLAVVANIFRELRHMFRYWIYCRRGVNAYVERHRIQTYEKEEEYLELCMREFQKRRELFVGIEEKLKRGEDLNADEVNLLQSSGVLKIEPKRVYNQTLCSFSDYIRNR